MPHIVTSDETESSGLDDTLDRLDAYLFDTFDEESLSNATVALRRLFNNRDFLGDVLVERLAATHASPEEFESGYGPQSIVLSGVRNGYFLRANVWPAQTDEIYAASGASSFVYGMPHDHNFSFLTVGYFGPGYRSAYYEYDYCDVVGNVGEQADLRLVGESSLEEGKMQLYRAHLDIHDQIPPESMSVSLNVVELNEMSCWYDQYGFDLENGTITGLLNPNGTETFLRIALGLGGEEAQDLAERFGRTHPSHRIRLASYAARADMQGDPAISDAIWAEGERKSGSLRVQREALRRRRELEVLTA